MCREAWSASFPACPRSTASDDDLIPFAITTLLVAAALLVAVGSNRVAEWVRVPAPALFLIVAAVASDLVPRLGSLSTVVDQRIVTIALVLILFDGGMHIGWPRMRETAGAVAWLGIMGTLVTTAALALGAHYLFGFDWRLALIIGAALAPTDPAVVILRSGPTRDLGTIRDLARRRVRSERSRRHRP